MEDSQNKLLDEPVPEIINSKGTYVPPSVDHSRLLAGESYSHYSPCPVNITPSAKSSTEAEKAEPTPCVLGIDEAGRGPVLGPMVYSAFYLPIHLHNSLLADEHHFDDSKVLTPEVRSNLMRSLCTQGHSLHNSCGWAVKVMSARDISSGMLRPSMAAVYNLNAQALDATIEIIRGVVETQGIDVKEVYVDTIGKPETHQARLLRVFPGLKITVAKKADSLYPCVSAASVCAKVTRDAALEACYESWVNQRKRKRSLESGGGEAVTAEEETLSWGSGYPSDGKCIGWLKKDMNPLFGWGIECRFSWGTSKELLEIKSGVKVDWPVEEDESTMLVTQYFTSKSEAEGLASELRDWYGHKQAEIF
ncbi:ribonuclease H2 subunit A [Nannizzia gypsea CBS 118893]|uniref:Ribonuclease n=1 Tax=Arthroderma gypseum (strain ATCC MYA-4604 / CBS 118893) TaxID=535722 RepID=E4UZ22_ARTGP|nr:ribonuclease H2 subunit A [Nannizzia gypsea CBS 118893]EFR03352.1 ribonuclease H2 subunit A [Nannizzia gypsea CBS 118893]